MTLILASMTAGKFWAMSDILLSVSGARPEMSAQLPLHDQPVSLATDSHTVVGTAQKSIILGDRTLLQWAGSQVVGEAVARAILEALEAGPEPDLQEVLRNPDLGLAGRQDISLILHGDRGAGPLTRVQVNVQMTDGTATAYAGTGSFNFLDDVQTELTPQGEIDEKPNDRWYARLAVVLAEEFFFKDPLLYAYGGWHEVIGVLPQGGFAKAPYLVKFWTRENGVVLSGPVFTCWYVNHHLCILGASGGQGVGELHRLAIVPAWNQPVIDEAVALADFEPARFQIHIVNQDGMLKFFWSGADWPNGFGMNLLDGRPWITLGPEVFAKILTDSERAGTLSRYSTPDI